MNIKNVVLFLSLSICSLGMAFNLKNEKTIKQSLEEANLKFALQTKIYEDSLADCIKKHKEVQESTILGSILGEYYPDLFIYECNVCEDENETLSYIRNEKIFLEKQLALEKKLAKIRKNNK